MYLTIKNVSCRYFVNSLYQVKFSFIPNLLGIFTKNECFILSNAFSASIAMTM